MQVWVLTIQLSKRSTKPSGFGDEAAPSDVCSPLERATRRLLLHYMAMNGFSNLLSVLVDAGFDVNERDSDYRTSLHLAVIANNSSAGTDRAVWCQRPRSRPEPVVAMAVMALRPGH